MHKVLLQTKNILIDWLTVTLRYVNISRWDNLCRSASSGSWGMLTRDNLYYNSCTRTMNINFKPVCNTSINCISIRQCFYYHQAMYHSHCMIKYSLRVDALLRHVWQLTIFYIAWHNKRDQFSHLFPRVLVLGNSMCIDKRPSVPLCSTTISILAVKAGNK